MFNTGRTNFHFPRALFKPRTLNRRNPSRKHQGHHSYYGITGNAKVLQRF